MEKVKKGKMLGESMVADKNAKQMSRRRFFQLAGSAAATGAAALALPKKLMASQGMANKSCMGGGSGTWKKVQNEFILDPHYVYMNIGTTGSMPKKVIQAYNEYNKRIAQRPWDYSWFAEGWPYQTSIRERIAPQYGADVSQLEITGNTTEGTCMVLNGLPLEAGDVVLTTHHEHVAVTSPLAILRDRRGVVIEEVIIPVYPPPTTVEEVVACFEQAIVSLNPKPKLLTFSHITYKTGTRLPAKEICALAQNYGIPTLVDGAHAPGMIQLDFNDMGCDYYAASGHKWQCGPGGTGILFIKNREKDPLTMQNPIWPTLADLYEYRNYEFYPGHPLVDGMASLFQDHGNPNFPAMLALADACDFWTALGRDAIENYVLDLSHYLKTRIADVFGPQTLYSSDTRYLSSGLTAFNPFDDPTDRSLAEEFKDRLRDEYHFVIRTTDFKINSPHYNYMEPSTYCLRISTHLFHDYDQIDRLMEAMYDLYRDMVG